MSPETKAFSNPAEPIRTPKPPRYSDPKRSALEAYSFVMETLIEEQLTQRYGKNEVLRPDSYHFNFADALSDIGDVIGNQPEVSGIPNTLPTHDDIVIFPAAAPKPERRVA